MPHDTNWRERGVEWRYFGHVTPAETRAADDAFTADPRSDTARYQLIDLRDVESLPYPEPEQEVTAALDAAQARSTPDVRVAFIVPDGRFDAALATYVAHVNASSWEAGTFTDADAARAWAERRPGPGPRPLDGAASVE